MAQVEARRFPGRPTIVVIDGEPYPLTDAAPRLGLTREALKKRIQRGASLTKPLQRHER